MSIGKKVIFILIISIFFIEFSFGYDDELRFKYLNLPGVPSDAVLNVAQDSTGYIWITTRKTGLFKYDGIKYKHYPEIKKPWTIIVSPSNNVVVGSKLGIYKYNRLEDKFDQILKNTVAGSFLRLFYFDDVNTILRRNDSLFVYNESNQLFFILDEIRITDIKKITKNLFIASTQSGIYEINISEKETRKITNLRTFKLHRDVDDSNTLWFGYYCGIGKYNLKTSDVDTTNFTTKLVITDILRDSKDILLLATTDGLHIFNKKSYKVTLEKFNESWAPSIIDMIIDNTKTYWFATFKGLIKSDLKQIIQNYFPSNNQYGMKRSDNITTMCSTPSDNIWFVSNERKINLLDERKEIIPFEIKSYNYNENKIRNILMDQERCLWVSTEKNVKQYHINKSSNSLEEVRNTEISHPVFLKNDKFNNIWISSFKNLYRYNSKGLIKKYNISNATAIHAINDSICFLGVHSKNYPSIRKLNFKTGQIEEEISLIKYRPQIGGLAIKNLIYDTSKEKFYIGTSTTGLITIDRNKSISIYSTAGGMPANNILGMVFDSKERLWLNTPDGLVLFEDRLSTFDYTNGIECYRKLKRNQLVKYGFYSNNLILSNAKNSIFLGGRNGLTSFNPDLLLYKSEKTDIILNSIHLYGEEIYRDKVINGSKKFQFSYRNRILTFNFAIMNFKKPEANKYAFKLENFNNSWEYSDNNEITYQNLHPGDYILKTKYSDYTGKWWQGPTYNIIITPPFWQTYSFWIIVIVITGIAVFSVIKIQTYRIRNQKVSLEYRVLQRTKDLREKKNELQRVNQGLEELVDVRTKKLTITNKQLIREIEEKEKVYGQLQQSQKKIKSNLKMQTTLSELSIKFISLENFEEKIGNTLQTIGEKFGFSSVFLYQTSHFVQEKNTVIQWLKDDTIEMHTDLTQQEYADYLAVLHSNGEILIEDAKEADVEIRNILEKIETRSLFIVPLMVGQKFYGFIGADKRQEKYSWNNSILHFIRTIGHILAYAYDRRAFQSELLESEKTSRALLNASDSFAILFNSDARIELANQNFLKVINKSLDEAIGHTIFDFFPPAHIEERRKQFYNCLKTKKTAEFEDQLNDQVYYNSITPIFDIDDKIKRIAFFSTNITKLKEAERILKQHQEELQKEVDARTKELRFINNELVREIKNRERAEEELLETEKVKRENLKKLALQLAHEIKNPLSSIKSSAQLVETIQTMKPDVKSTIKHMSRITRNVDTCNRVIKELYEFTHDAELQVQKVKIGTLFNEVIDYTEDLLENSSVSLKSESNIYDLWLSIDKFKMMQALKNVINNSKEAIVDEGEIAIDFIEKNKVLNIRIADTGTGMTEEQLNKIFEPFFTSKSKGFGLGLAIVKKIIEQHQGMITVTSQPGEGTATIITLPCNGEKNG